MTHILHLFGWTGSKIGYLDIPIETAKARYAKEQGSAEDAPYEAVHFNDTLHVYSAWSDDTPTIEDQTAALAAAEVRADVTNLMVTIGTYAPFTEVGGNMGRLFLALVPSKKRDAVAGYKIYAVTETLGDDLLALNAQVTIVQGETYWLRPRTGPLNEDPALQDVVKRRAQALSAEAKD